MEGLFLCGEFKIPETSGEGVRTKAKRYLEENVPDFDPREDYYCGINPLTPTTAIRWAEVKGDKENPNYPAKSGGNFCHRRYFIVRFNKSDPTKVDKLKTLAGAQREALVTAFKKKYESMNTSGRKLNLSRVNINENIGEDEAKGEGGTDGH